MGKRAAVAAFLLVVAGGASAGASEFHHFDREELICSSEAVVRGVVAGIESRWSEDGSVIVTEAEVAVEEAWKGSPAGTILVRTLGGTVGTVRLVVDGAAVFVPGERVVLFLEEAGDAWVPAGMRFGKYEVQGDAADPFVVGALPPAVPGSRTYETVSLRLDELRDEVEAVLRKEDR